MVKEDEISSVKEKIMAPWNEGNPFNVSPDQQYWAHEKNYESTPYLHRDGVIISEKTNDDKYSISVTRYEPRSNKGELLLLNYTVLSQENVVVSDYMSVETTIYPESPFRKTIQSTSPSRIPRSAAKVIDDTIRTILLTESLCDPRQVEGL